MAHGDTDLTNQHGYYCGGGFSRPVNDSLPLNLRLKSPPTSAIAFYRFPPERGSDKDLF